MSTECHFCKKTISDVTSDSVMLLPFDKRSGDICYDENSHYATFWPTNPFAHRKCYARAREKEHDDRRKRLEPEIREHKAFIRRVKKAKKPEYGDLCDLNRLENWNEAARIAVYEEFGGIGYRCRLEEFLRKHGHSGY